MYKRSFCVCIHVSFVLQTEISGKFIFNCFVLSFSNLFSLLWGSVCRVFFSFLFCFSLQPVSRITRGGEWTVEEWKRYYCDFVVWVYQVSRNARLYAPWNYLFLGLSDHDSLTSNLLTSEIPEGRNQRGFVMFWLLPVWKKCRLVVGNEVLTENIFK